MRHPLLFLCWAAALAGCAKKGPDVHAEAEALAQQGKIEEAAAKVDLICAFAPDGDPCRASDRHAVELRIQAAEKAMGEGRFARAERLFILALAMAHAKAAESATQRLASEDLKQGVAYERALAGADKRAIMKAMEGIAATKTPVAAQAKAWLDRERPGLLIEAVKAACGPAHEGSCSSAAAALTAAAVAGPETEAAIALAEEEERRVYPLRVNAEVFLQTFAAVAKRDILSEACKIPGEVQGGGANIPTTVRGMCHNFCGCTSYVLPPQEVEEQIQKRRINDVVWRRTMKSIADPALVAALEERRGGAQGNGGIDKIDVPKPKPAPKGGKK